MGLLHYQLHKGDMKDDNKFITIGSSTYEVADATPGTAMALRSYLKNHVPDPLKMLNEMRQSPMWESLSQDTKTALEKEAAFSTLAGKKEISDEAIADLLLEPQHCAMLAWFVLREKNQVTLDRLKAEITKDNVAAVCWDIIAKSGFNQLGKKYGLQLG